jgi:hypothetical protein
VLLTSKTRVGHSAGDRDRVFDWFYQGEGVPHGRVRAAASVSQSQKEFVAAHGGRIEVVDESAGGAPSASRFLPGQHDPTVAALSFACAPPGAPHSPLRREQQAMPRLGNPP